MAIDVGCGTGQATLALAQHFDRVVGIDISENQISEAGKSINDDEKLRKTIEFRWSAIVVGLFGSNRVSHDLSLERFIIYPMQGWFLHAPEGAK